VIFLSFELSSRMKFQPPKIRPPTNLEGRGRARQNNPMELKSLPHACFRLCYPQKEMNGDYAGKLQLYAVVWFGLASESLMSKLCPSLNLGSKRQMVCIVSLDSKADSLKKNADVQTNKSKNPGIKAHKESLSNVPWLVSSPSSDPSPPKHTSRLLS